MLSTLHMEEENSSFPPFLLAFEVFNYNVQNFLVDLGATTNLMSLSIAKNINAQWSNKSTQIIQLDWTSVLSIGELQDVIIKLSHDIWVHQCINIVVVDIPEEYALLLGKDWSSKMNGYFVIDWSHMWLPYKGKSNQIQVIYERYMSHNVTPIKGENEPLAFVELMFGNFPRCYPAQPTPSPPDMQSSILPCPTDSNEACTIHCINSSSSSSNNGINNTSTSNGLCTNELWTMYFDGSKTQDGLGYRCVLINSNIRKHLVSSCLEFECTKNIV